MSIAVVAVLFLGVAIGGRMVVWGLNAEDGDLQHWVAAAVGGVMFAASVAALAERIL